MAPVARAAWASREVGGAAQTAASPTVGIAKMGNTALYICVHKRYIHLVGISGLSGPYGPHFVLLLRAIPVRPTIFKARAPNAVPMPT